MTPGVPTPAVRRVGLRGSATERWAAGRAWLYDKTVRVLTDGWYRAAFERFPDGARVLDVGIGPGGALIHCADLLVGKDLDVVGLDIDDGYLARCRSAVATAGMSDRVVVIRESVEVHAGGPYEVVYFGASLMVLPDPVAALRQVGGLLAAGGRVYLTQTFQHRRSPVLERLKPLAKLVTTVDFGRVTYEHEFRGVLRAAGLELEELVTLERKRRRSYRLAIARRPVGA